MMILCLVKPSAMISAGLVLISPLLQPLSHTRAYTHTHSDGFKQFIFKMTLMTYFFAQVQKRQYIQIHSTKGTKTQSDRARGSGHKTGEWMSEWMSERARRPLRRKPPALLAEFCSSDKRLETLWFHRVASLQSCCVIGLHGRSMIFSGAGESRPPAAPPAAPLPSQSAAAQSRWSAWWMSGCIWYPASRNAAVSMQAFISALWKWSCCVKCWPEVEGDGRLIHPPSSLPPSLHRNL